MHAHAHNYKDRRPVLDAMYEVAFTWPESAGDNLGGLSDATLREAMAMIPDEYHRSAPTMAERFIAAVLANAADCGRSPYTIALLALDAS